MNDTKKRKHEKKCEDCLDFNEWLESFLTIKGDVPARKKTLKWFEENNLLNILPEFQKLPDSTKLELGITACRECSTTCFFPRQYCSLKCKDVNLDYRKRLAQTRLVNNSSAKQKETFIKKYGVDHHRKISSVVEKSNVTRANRSDEYIAASKLKRQERSMEKYGVHHPSASHYSPELLASISRELVEITSIHDQIFD